MRSSSLPSVGRSALADHVYSALYEGLLALTVEPGGRLNIDQLARQLEVSPTPVREALARLEADGLVVKRPLSGYVTTPVLAENILLDQYDLRLQVEPWLARLAAQQSAAERRAAMDPLADAGADAEPLARSDLVLHDTIAALSGNTEARRALQRVHAHFHVYRYFQAHDDAPAVGNEHAALVTAIIDGDPSQAQDAMHAHLLAARRRLAALA